MPSDDILESVYKLRIRESDQFKTVLELYDMEIHQKISVPNYRLRNLDAKHGRIESGHVIENRKGIIWVEGGKGICYQWKEKGSVREETVAVSATKPKIVRKNQNTLPPHLLSQPHHGVEVCRRKEASKAKVTMDRFFDNHADII